MDRFIEFHHYNKDNKETSLKSNMDRFIALVCYAIRKLYVSLKSNMDRFIASDQNYPYCVQLL